MLKTGGTYGEGDEALEFYAKHTAQIEVSCHCFSAPSEQGKEGNTLDLLLAVRFHLIKNTSGILLHVLLENVTVERM